MVAFKRKCFLRQFDQIGVARFSFSFRGYYVVVMPLKKQRGGKFLNPWEDPDQMNLDEVCSRNNAASS